MQLNQCPAASDASTHSPDSTLTADADSSASTAVCVASAESACSSKHQQGTGRSLWWDKPTADTAAETRLTVATASVEDAVLRSASDGWQNALDTLAIKRGLFAAPISSRPQQVTAVCSVARICSNVAINDNPTIST